MRIMVEIESETEMKRYERFLRLIDPSLIKQRKKSGAKKTKEFLDAIEKLAIPVDTVHIPDREFRNVR